MDWHHLAQFFETCEFKVDKSNKGWRVSAKGPAAIVVLAILALAVSLR